MLGMYGRALKLTKSALPVTLGISKQPPRDVGLANAQVQPTLKLPVWPIWGGVLAQIADWVGAKKVSASILSKVGGRVIPMSLSDMKVSPFLLLVHHRHSFTSFDPIRPLTKLLLPEGFPAHPHSGFDTVTYCLQGGLKHRDSEGESMKYGVNNREDHKDATKLTQTNNIELDQGHAEIQWMRAGRGVIHEEMWDIPTGNQLFYHHPIELFQLWVNLPSECKSAYPSTNLLYSSQMPVYASETVDVKVIAGKLALESGEELVGEVGNALAASPLGIYHITIPPIQPSKQSMPNICLSSFDHAVLYVRTGEGKVADTQVKPGDLVTLRPPSSQNTQTSCLIPLLATGDLGLDCLLLVGQDLREESVSGGAFVLSNMAALEKYQRIFGEVAQAGGFWSAGLSDKQWREHIKGLDLQKRIDAWTKGTSRKAD